MDTEGKPLREAGEVFIYMHRIFRASRNLRAHWYIDNLGKPITIQEFPPCSSTQSSEKQSDDTNVDSDAPNKYVPAPHEKQSTSSDEDNSSTASFRDEYTQEMTVVGIIPVGGDGSEIVGDEQFMVTIHTKCSFISRYYRIVFILDLSPSIVMADDESNCCLVDRVIPSLRSSLRSSVKSFTIPGTTRSFQPQVFTSVCVFSPFMKFEETFTLCQGVFATESNVDIVLDSVQIKFVEIYKRLFTFSRPILELWGKLKRRHKHNKFDSLCESDSQSDENVRKVVSIEELQGIESSASSNGIPGEKYLNGDIETLRGGNLMQIQRGIWTATERSENQKQFSFASDKSYVTPDWSLIFMLRMGLLQIQMLPENTQSNLVIISDSVCGMPDEQALQNVLSQLRSYTVAFSFIQLQKRACAEPVFGHIGSSSLFYFMTMATFGTYLPRQKPKSPRNRLKLTRSENGLLVITKNPDYDEIITESNENINQYHRALICWSFQNGLNDNDYLLDTFSYINKDFMELQQSHVDRHRRFVANYKATLNRMMYVRLREGFTLKSTVFVRNNTQVILTLRLAFRPLVFIDYIITSSWPIAKNVRQEVNVELVLEGPYNELKDLLTESNYLNPARMNLIKSVIDGIIDADRLLLHIHSFDTKLAYFTIPAGVTKEYALFQQGDSAKQILPQLCIVKPDGIKIRGFVNFWKKMLEVDDGNWQKWVHTQTERSLLNLIHVPFELFTTERVLKFDCRYPLNALLYSVKVRSSFCLVENQTYVTLVYESQESVRPLYFFIRKIICNGPVAIIKTAFLGGVTSTARRKAVEAQRQRLINVTYGTILNEEDLKKEARRYRYEANAEKLYMDPQKILEKRGDPACTVFRRPLERMIVRYNYVPADLTTIVRAEEKTDDAEEIMLLTLHNTLAKSLSCRRSVILLNTFQPGGAHVVRLLADFCQNVIMHKRMHQEGFKPCWTRNNSVSLIRQVYDSSGASLEQFIMFPAITIQPDIMNNPILKRKPKYDRNKWNEGLKDAIVRNGLPSKTAIETLAIVCEMWNEPEGGNPADQLANMSSEQRLNEDLRFVSILFSLDKVIRHSGQCSEIIINEGTSKNSNQSATISQMFPYDDRCRCTNIYELTGLPKNTPQTPEEKATIRRLRPKSRRRTEKLRSQMDLEKEWEREKQGAIDVPKPPTPGIFPIRCVEMKTEGEEEVLGELDEPFPYLDEKDKLKTIPPAPTVTDIHASPVSKFVTVYDNLFNLSNLIYHAQRKYSPLPHFVLGRNNLGMSRCNKLQLNALHCQLSEIADLTWTIDDTEQDIVWADLIKTIPEQERPFKTPLRIYVKALTARMVALMFAPVTDKFDVNSEVIPLFLMTIHETQIAHCYSQNGFDENGIVIIPMSEVPERWDSGARFGWTPNNRNVFPEEATTFSSFCQHFEDEILPRIRMRAMYEAAQENIPLNEESLMEMSGDVDCLEFEMSDIPVALRKLCKHLKSNHPPSKETICCRGSNIAHMFNKMLGKNFKKVDGTDNMFYLNPESMIENKTKKNRTNSNQRTRGNSGLMYVDGTDSMTSLSEAGEERSQDGDTEDQERTITDNYSSSSSSDKLDDSSSGASSSSSSARAASPPSSSDCSDSDGRTRLNSANYGEEYEEYTGKTQPMFIQFNCSVNFNGKINTFPINFLPTCIHELLPFVENAPTDPCEISKVEIVLELLVLITQSLKPTMDINEINTRLIRMAKSRVRNPYEFERHRRESYKKEEEEEQVTSEEEVEMENKKDTLFDLPPQERKVMTDLVKNVGVILELEKILLESRVEKVDENLLEDVKSYIDNACTSSGKVGHAETRIKPFILVDSSQPKINKFMNLMDNRECGYLKIVRQQNTNMFYCRSINDLVHYNSMKPSVREDDDQIGPQNLADFWIIVTVDVKEQFISLHFCQRHAHQHSVMLDQMWAGIRQELRILNQECLLEIMYVQRNVDKLLVPEYRKIPQFDENDTRKAMNNIKSELKPNGKSQKHIRDVVPDDMYFYFAEGYFACKLQRELWIPVPERVRNQSQLLHKNPLTLAFEKIKAPLLKYSVQNRMNTFVYKDATRNQIFYFQLHMDRDSYELAVKGTKAKLRRKQLETVEKMLETKICLTIFGITEPHQDIVQKIWNSLMEKLDSQLLTDIMRGYSQNQEQPLLISEIDFLQQDGPQIRKFFSIPFIFEEYLPSLLFYICQHIEAISNISPAKVKEQGVFYNGAAFNRNPVMASWSNTRSKSVSKKSDIAAISDIILRIEENDGIFRVLSTEEKPELREPLNPSFIFRPHPPVVGTLPEQYLLSSFFIYHILPARGIIGTGIALIEFRITKPDGRLFSKFDQPSMNEQSHDLLVPNVPDDKATLYRDIIKSHTYSSPKPEKSICGYLEMIVWTKGDVVESSFEKMMRELIEMAMFDVITEFGYLNTTIVEEGIFTGTVSLTNRNSDVFLPGQDSTAPDLKHLTQQHSASSVTASVDTRHHHHAAPSHSGEIRRSLVLQHGPGSIDISLNPVSSINQRTNPTARMSSIAKDIEQHLSSNEVSIRRTDFMNRKNAYSIIKWLDYVASKHGETNSVVKKQIRFEFQHASLPALFEIRNRLEISLGGLQESEIRERVYLCGLRKHSPSENDSHNGISLRESNLSIYGTTSHDGRFEVLTTDPFHAMTDDFGVDESQCQEEYILVSCIRNVFDGFGENMIRTKSQVEEMKQMFRNHLHGKYNPLVQTHMYSPRQRIMIAYLKGDYMTIYFYNYHYSIHKEAVDCTNKIVGFHNAKSRLLREIGLHKMGITHLSPFHTEPVNEYDYEALIWTDPITLISKEFPIDHKPPPTFMKEPQCSNIFFRMYRQPDLQVTMGRSKTHFKSDCVKTMHYEQLLRWRSGLKTKLDFIQKVTRAHVEMIKKVPVINECDLLLFLRPPKATRKLGPPPASSSSTSSVRHRQLDEDYQTEDNNSMTERTSKRASLHGESIKSQAIAESEIFKGKGEFLKKTEIKLGLATTKFHEIRTPFFLRSEWNQDAPRRSGVLFDEVVRESDIRSILEEPLKEFMDIYEGQKAKTTKQLMKRKYSEKSVEVQITDIIIKNEERKKGEEELKVEDEEEWSDDDSDFEDVDKMSNEDGGDSYRSTSESRGLIVGDENFQRMYGKVRRSWKINPPGSPMPFDSRHNSISSVMPMTKQSESGPIEKMLNFTLNAASKISRKLSRKQPEKESPIDKCEEAVQHAAPIPEPANNKHHVPIEPAIVPIMYKHAEEFARYFTRKYKFIQFTVENKNRRSKALNRYTTNTSMFHDLPYLVFYKAYDGGAIFADLKYEVPEFVVSFYMYERAKMSSADYYMVDRMEALYWKESEELHYAALQLKLQESVCFMTFNFDYHLRAVATFLDAKTQKKKCLFGSSMNVFHLIERLLDFYQYDLILSKNLVAIKYLYMTKEQNDELLARQSEEKGMVLLKIESDAITERRYAGTPIEDAICKITESHLYKTSTPVTILELTGILSSSSTPSTSSCGRQYSSRVIPSIKLRVHMDDVGDGELWPPTEDREFVQDFEGKQRRLLLRNMSKYGTESVPTPWEDSCVRRTVREMMAKRKSSSSS